jgi:hypothetical protein
MNTLKKEKKSHCYWWWKGLGKATAIAFFCKEGN